MSRPTRMPTPSEKKDPALRRRNVMSVVVAVAGLSTKSATDERLRRRCRRRAPDGLLYGLEYCILQRLAP